MGEDYESRFHRYFSRLEERMSRPFDGFSHKPGVVWAVVFTYNRQALLRQAVHSLRAVEPHIKIVVVDNGSSDGTQEALVQMYNEGAVDKILLNKHEDVPQWQKAYNMHQVFRLLAMEECESLVWMDDDVQVRRPFIRAAAAIIEQLGSQGVVLVSMLTDEEQNYYHPTEKEQTVDGVQVRVKNTFNGAFVFFPVQLLRELGLPPIREGNDELASEDWYYSRMLQTKGLKVAAVDFADHLGADASMRKKIFL